MSERFDQLNPNSVVIAQKAAVTQATSITTGVTANACAGVITTVSSTLAAAASTAFTLTNSYITASSVVIAVIQGYSGTWATNGAPQVAVGSVTDGSCSVVLTNNAPSNALSGTLKIGFLVC